MNATSNRRQWLKVIAPIAAITVIVVLWSLFFWRILTPNLADRLTFQQGDFTMQFLAYRQMAYRQIAVGHFPSYEECLYSGYPFQADPQSQVLYPPVMGMLLLGRALGWPEYPLRALEWEVMLHILFAALGMYAFLRDKGDDGQPVIHAFHPAAAVFGAVAYAFGGFMTGYAMLQTGILETAAWTPLILLLLRRLIISGPTAKLRWTITAGLLALCVACAFTAGHPQSLLFIIYAGAAAFLFWRAKANLPWAQAIKRVALAGALAIGLSAAQLIPQLLFAQASTRASINFVQAGNGFQLSDLWLLLTNQNFTFWQPIYIGVPGLLLAIIGLGNRRFAGRHRDADRHLDARWLWLGLLITALVLSFGANALGYDIAYLIAPGYGQFRSQERHAAIATFALCTLAAYGLDGLLAPLRARGLVQLHRSGRQLLAWSGAMAAIVIFVRAYGSANVADVLALANRLTLVFIGLLGMGAALLLRARLGTKVKSSTQLTGWSLLPLGLLVFDLFSITRYTSTQSLAPPFPDATLISAITNRQARSYNHYGLDFNMLCVNGLREIGGGSPIVLKHYDTFLKRTSEDVFSKLLNVRNTITWRGGLGLDNDRTIPTRKLADDKYQNNAVHLFELQWSPDDKDEAWLSPHARYANDEDELYGMLNAPDFDPFSDVVILVQDQAPSAAPSRTETNSAQLHGQIGVEGSAIGYFKIAAFTEAPTMLVISRAYHPNWVALVNGSEVTPIRVDGALIGVPLPAGNSGIELSYRPTDLYVGVAISAITLVIAIAIIFMTDPRSIGWRA